MQMLLSYREVDKFVKFTRSESETIFSDFFSKEKPREPRLYGSRVTLAAIYLGEQISLLLLIFVAVSD